MQLNRLSSAGKSSQECPPALQPLGKCRGMGNVFASRITDRDNKYLMLNTTLVRAHHRAATGRAQLDTNSETAAQRVNLQADRGDSYEASFVGKNSDLFSAQQWCHSGEILAAVHGTEPA